MSEKTNKIGLGLSGGGYRAAAYHLGTMDALKNIKILDNRPDKNMEEKPLLSAVDNFSTVSGGSVTGAHYVCEYGKYKEKYKDTKDTKEKQNAFNIMYENHKKTINKRFLNKNCEFFTVIRSKSLFIIPILVGMLFYIMAIFLYKVDIYYKLVEAVPVGLLEGAEMLLVPPANVFSDDNLNIIGKQSTNEISNFILPNKSILIRRDEQNKIKQLYVREGSIVQVPDNENIYIEYLTEKILKGLFPKETPTLAASDEKDKEPGKPTKVIKLPSGSKVISFPIIDMIITWIVGFGTGAFFIALLLIYKSKMFGNPKLSILLRMFYYAIILVILIIIIKIILDLISMPTYITGSYLLGIIIYIVWLFIYLFSKLGFSKRKYKFLKNRLFKNLKLSDLPDEPCIAMNATVFETGDLLHFSKSKINFNSDNPDYINKLTKRKVTFTDAEKYPLADAVSKSCNWPPLYEPELILEDYYNLKFFENEGKHNNSTTNIIKSLIEKIKYLFNRHKMSKKYPISLSDGGSVDNHGISKLADKDNYDKLFSKFILISNADPPFETKKAELGIINQIFELITVVLFTNVANYTKKVYVDHFENKKGAVPPLYISLADDVESLLSEYKNETNVYNTAFKERIEELFKEENKNFSYDKEIKNISNEMIFEAIEYKSNHFIPADKEQGEILKKIRKIQTRLIPINKKLQKDLIMHSRTLTDFLVKFWLLNNKKGETYIFRNCLQ